MNPLKKSARIKVRRNQFGLRSVPLVIQASSRAKAHFTMTAISNNSHSANPQPRSRVVAGYVYQGATIIAVLLLVLSAAV